MTNKEYIEELTGRGLPDWAVEQVADELDKRDAKIEQLKADIDAHIHKGAERQLEIERLKAHHKIAVDNWTLEAQTVKQQEDVIHELRHKVERLREALLEVADLVQAANFREERYPKYLAVLRDL